MSSDDFDMVAYRVLRYIDACLKGGVYPTVAQASAFSKADDGYLAVVLGALSMSGVETSLFYDGTVGVSFHDAHVTVDGAHYLRCDPVMQAARKQLGEPFESAVEVAVRKLSIAGECV